MYTVVHKIPWILIFLPRMPQKQKNERLITLDVTD